MLVASAAFFLTRAVAASNRDMSLRDAAEWYRRGQQEMQAGQVDDAIDAFRRATFGTAPTRDMCSRWLARSLATTTRTRRAAH